MIAQQKFPKDFLWGASTASHQVEGGTVNQWSQWELEHAVELAAAAEKRLGHLPNWKDIRQQAESPENYVSGQGVDHYNRYKEDFDLLEKLQFNSLRFGVEWSRLEPEEGAFNLEEIKHYHDYIDELLIRGITPVLNIWHWTMPTWFTDKGGFENKDNLPLFDAYVQKIADEYGDKIKYFITLNEPNVYSTFGYVTGEWPPQQKKYLTFLKVYHNLTKAHRRAYDILKKANPTAQVGVAAQLANIQAKHAHSLIDVAMTKIMRYGWNWWFLNRIKRRQDFVGINYYFTDYYHGTNGKDTPRVPTNDVGWYMEPEGLYPLLVRAWKHYKKPIIITENGVADQNDQYREWWLEQTIIAMQRALSEGVVIKGYMHWSLLDNFEWAFGWWPKFGLIEVDREDNMKRTPRPSAIWLARYMMELQGKDTPSKPTSAKAKSAATAITEAANVEPEAAGIAAVSSGGPRKPKRIAQQPTNTAIAATPKPQHPMSRERRAALRQRLHVPAMPKSKTGKSATSNDSSGTGISPRRINLKRFRSKIQ